MNDKIRIVFIGGLTNGEIVYDYLQKNKFVNLVLVITYPDDSKKPRFVKFSDNKTTIKDNFANKYLYEIKEAKPDYIFVAGWSELLSEELINIPSKGTVGFHPAKLPYDKGRSVLAWQIEEGYNETALTMFYYSNFPDGGDIIGQDKITINFIDNINHILNKIDDATYNLMRAYFPLIRKGIEPRKKQDLNMGNFRRLRTDKDSLINWEKDSIEIYNKVRAISHPYPGAFGYVENKKIRIWETEIVKVFPYGHFLAPGNIVAKLYNKKIIVKTRDSFLLLCEYEYE